MDAMLLGQSAHGAVFGFGRHSVRVRPAISARSAGAWRSRPAEAYCASTVVNRLRADLAVVTNGVRAPRVASLGRPPVADGVRLAGGWRRVSAQVSWMRLDTRPGAIGTDRGRGSDVTRASGRNQLGFIDSTSLGERWQMTPAIVGT